MYDDLVTICLPLLGFVGIAWFLREYRLIQCYIMWVIFKLTHMYFAFLFDDASGLLSVMNALYGFYITFGGEHHGQQRIRSHVMVITILSNMGMTLLIPKENQFVLIEGSSFFALQSLMLSMVEFPKTNVFQLDDFSTYLFCSLPWLMRSPVIPYRYVSSIPLILKLVALTLTFKKVTMVLGSITEKEVEPVEEKPSFFSRLCSGFSTGSQSNQELKQQPSDRISELLSQKIKINRTMYTPVVPSRESSERNKKNTSNSVDVSNNQSINRLKLFKPAMKQNMFDRGNQFNTKETRLAREFKHILARNTTSKMDDEESQTPTAQNASHSVLELVDRIKKNAKESGFF